jgi:hypothetical protein
MIIRASDFQAPRSQACFNYLRRATAGVGLLALGLSLSACATDISEGVSQAFADPAKYELYDCKQLETERKNLAKRTAELQGLMAKADTGFAGPVVAELAYRNDYVAVRGQSHFAEEAWQKSKCRESPPTPEVAPPKPGLHVKSAKLVKGPKASDKASDKANSNADAKTGQQ